MSDLISIIIPIYNSEKTLERCLESVVNQNYSNLEIILINDGSKDKSRDICEKFAQKDNRIILINKKNEGVGKARNVGLEKSTGQYISFVDSDDYIEKDAISKLYNKLKKENVDLVKGNYDIITRKGINTNFEPIIDKKYTKENIDEFIYELLTERVKSFLWLLLIKKEFIKDKFSEEISLYEDVNFYLSVLGNVNSIYVFSDIIYHYVIFAQNSLSRNIEKVDAQIQELIKANDILKETLKKYKFYNEKNIKALDTSVIKNIINYYYYKYKVIKKINKVIKSFEELKEDISVKNILINYDDSILSKKEKLFNKSLLNKRYFLFGTLCKIKDILNQSKNKRKKVFINAYMVKNLGDDLFLKIFINRYGEKNKLYLYVNKEYKDVLKGNFIAYKNKIIVFFNKLLKLITIDRMDIETLLSKNEILVRIGGSMFIEENNSNYKERIKKEFSIKHKYYILGSNFGPYISDDYKKTYKEVFKNAEDVCFRDQYSYELFKELPNVRYSSDIVFGLDISKINKTKGKKAVISIVDCDLKIGKGYKEKYETKILELINHLINKGYEIVLMSFCKLENDEMAIKEIYEQIDEKMKVKVSKYFYRGNIEEALNVLGESKVIIGSRFHANIIGFILNKTVIPVAYSDKTLNVLKDLKFDGKIIDIRKIDEFDVKKLTYKDLNYKISVKEQIEMANEHFKIIDNDLN